MRLCVISLGGESSKKIAEEAKEFFDEVLEINLKNIELCVDNKGFFVKNGSERLEDFDCVYIMLHFHHLQLYATIQYTIQDFSLHFSFLILQHLAKCNGWLKKDNLHSVF